MIIEAFSVFFLLAFIFILIGYKSENIVLKLSGFFIIILLSFTFLTGTIEFKTGQITENCENVLLSTYELYQYGNNFTGYHWDYDTGTAPDSPQVDAYIFHKNTTYTYTEICANSTTTNQYIDFTGFNNILLGVFILFSALVGMYGAWDEFKGNRKGTYGEDED